MKINHIAIWTHDLEKLKDFYVSYFEGKSNERYENPKKGFESYFIYFSSGTSLELMKSIKLKKLDQQELAPGYAHMAFSLGDKETVDQLTEKLVADGFEKINGPRTTGDGYYESVIKDPDGNLVELTI
ncbi:VOC family protein [soil metagenome]